MSATYAIFANYDQSQTVGWIQFRDDVHPQAIISGAVVPRLIVDRSARAPDPAHDLGDQPPFNYDVQVDGFGLILRTMVDTRPHSKVGERATGQERTIVVTAGQCGEVSPERSCVCWLDKDHDGAHRGCQREHLYSSWA